jgi:protein TonB
MRWFFCALYQKKRGRPKVTSILACLLIRFKNCSTFLKLYLMENSKESTAVRQNSVYKSSRKHEANLRRNPTLHFQIGLILALLASIFFIEMRTPEKKLAIAVERENVDQIFTLDQVKVEQPKKEVIRKVQLPKIEEPKILENVQTKEDDSKFLEDDLKPTDATDDPIVDPRIPDYDDTVDDEPIAKIFSLVETAPLYPGCEGLSSNDERKDCMSAKISKFVSKKFRAERGEGLGLSGVNRIFVTFKIDASGKVVDVNAKAPHPKLEEEALRVTKLLPDMTAGKQAGENVAVLFSLPISFQIED